MAWYRNTDWSDEIAADFERRLARSRHQKAQNLSLQGFHLIARHPDVAVDLLERAIAFGDEFETPRALLYLATAKVALGDIDGALGAYETALDRPPGSRSSVIQPVDYLFLVGAFRRTERLPRAMALMDDVAEDGAFGADPEVFVAKALVLDLAGRKKEASHYASLALPALKNVPHPATVSIDMAEVRARLMRLANRF
ncbi:M48 family metallopeptidase [Parafrankia sp. BMG5.11]|uniref:tetratricopeptide repeat protein n=1 Tax=Parafrankia sp. BMG5.11 TaxID=222540 RepID=UPI00103D5F7E|nr:hypothetical protein [Parafrankia sp. BMG5.11]TCJ40946.1 hypothetical protein E0504_03355 [Parafrankia sp. BMG5.11]